MNLFIILIKKKIIILFYFITRMNKIKLYIYIQYLLSNYIKFTEIIQNRSTLNCII